LHLRGREIYAGGEAKSIAGLEFFSKTGFSCKLQAASSKKKQDHLKQAHQRLALACTLQLEAAFHCS
jgi:hypothetical protein